MKRILKEYNKFLQDPPDGITAGPVGDDVFHWTASIEGPAGTPYEGGWFFLDIEFPSKYPFEPPKVKLNTKIFHCNISSETSIIPGILEEAWNGTLHIEKILLYICALISGPIGGRCIENKEAARLYNCDRAQHDRIAREWAMKYADAAYELNVKNMITNEVVFTKDLPYLINVREIKELVSKELVSKKGLSSDAFDIKLGIPRGTSPLVDEQNLSRSDLADLQMLLVEKKRAPESVDLNNELEHYLIACARGEDLMPQESEPRGYSWGYGCLGHIDSGIIMMLPPLQIEDHISEDSIILYHYGPRQAFTPITGSTSLIYIRASHGERAHFGDGVYATQRAPHAFGTKDAVLLNNYTNKQDPVEQNTQIIKWRQVGMADYCFPLIVPRSCAVNVKTQKTREMTKVGHTARHDESIRDDRDIWVIVLPCEHGGDVQNVQQNIEQIYLGLQSSDYSIRLHAVQVLAGRAAVENDERATKALAAHLDEMDPSVRVAAIWGTACSGAWSKEEARSKLVCLIDNEHDDRVKETIREAIDFLSLP